jgi:hypothetical protein
MATRDENVQLVLKALENPKYKWRTIGGVSQETGLSADQVLEVLGSPSDKIVKSSIPSPEGKSLFTTREHFRKSASTFEKVLSAIKNRST